MDKLNQLYMEMIRYYHGDPARSQHFTKVHSYARLIGKLEGLDETMLLTLEAAAYVHDIGIRAAEETYGKCDGKLQEQLGPPLAEKMLKDLDFPQNIVERVSYLVGHHHTYTEVEGADYQILLEADFLVNLYEESGSSLAIHSAYDRIFKTESGKSICKEMFDITDR